MRRYKVIGTALCAGVLALCGGRADAEQFSARLDGFQELGALNAQTGAVLSNATGTLELNLDENSGKATWTLTYSDVGTTAPLLGNVTQAHIHFGKSRDSGGVMVFFCTNLGNGPAGTQACPLHSTSSPPLTGTFTAASVVAIAGQNVVAGNFNALAEALTSNTAYANIHTTVLGAGEIRGQIHRGELDQNRDRRDR